MGSQALPTLAHPTGSDLAATGVLLRRYSRRWSDERTLCKRNGELSRTQRMLLARNIHDTISHPIAVQQQVFGLLSLLV